MRCGAVRCGAVRCGAVRCGAVRFFVRYDTIRYGTVRYGTVRYGTVRYGTVRYGTVRYGAVRCGAVRYGAVRCGAVRCGAVRSGAVRGGADHMESEQSRAKGVLLWSALQANTRRALFEEKIYWMLAARVQPEGKSFQRDCRCVLLRIEYAQAFPFPFQKMFVPFVVPFRTTS